VRKKGLCKTPCRDCASLERAEEAPGWRVEAYTPMGILLYEPLHRTKEDAEKHKSELELKNPDLSFGVIEEKDREERNRIIQEGSG
jgi:hypothetical protein